MKSMSRSIGLIALNVLQYFLRQITPRTHLLGKIAAKPRTLSAEDWNKWPSHEKERWAGHQKFVLNMLISMIVVQGLYHIWKSVRTDFGVFGDFGVWFTYYN